MIETKMIVSGAPKLRITKLMPRLTKGKGRPNVEEPDGANHHGKSVDELFGHDVESLFQKVMENFTAITF